MILNNCNIDNYKLSYIPSRITNSTQHQTLLISYSFYHGKMNLTIND